MMKGYVEAGDLGVDDSSSRLSSLRKKEEGKLPRA